MEMKDNNGRNILELFYADIDRWSYTFQHVTLMTRIANTAETIKAAEGTDAVIVMERSILTDRYVFAEMLRKQGKLCPLEWDLYKRWYDLLTDFMPIDGIIHIDTDVDTCVERIKIRARPGETTPVEYLRDLDEAHRSWLSTSNHPVLTLSNTDGSTAEGRIEAVKDFLAYLRTRQALMEVPEKYRTPTKASSSAETNPAMESPVGVDELRDVVKRLAIDDV
jgi:deoxyadenosine/deoxycytidine kinase